MNKELYQKIKPIYDQAFGMGSVALSSFLDEKCGDDPVARAAIENLLRYSDSRFLEKPFGLECFDEFIAEGIFDDVDSALDPTLADSLIRNYRLIKQIGRGGMGTIYVAERTDGTYKSKVAIKIINRGMDTDAIMERFRIERQISATLNHPNIAKLFDGGTASDGRPYFVMEYIEGKRITDYANEKSLSIQERLLLFVTVCDALLYAHQNMVIHRDIKPSNILIDNSGTPKLLDFGIAKLLDPQLTGHSIQPTGEGLAMMTPDYASPEQFRREKPTTLTDVYSLGILLYELLTGNKPYRIDTGSLIEIERIITETIPKLPSESVEKTGLTDQTRPNYFSYRNARQNTPERLRRRLKGDLDGIVMKAINREKSKRYSGVGALIADINRFSVGVPVAARIHTTPYRISKFISRHVVGLTISILVIIVTLGICVALWQRFEASKQLQRVSKLTQVVRLQVPLLIRTDVSIKNTGGSDAMRKPLVEQMVNVLDLLSDENVDEPQILHETANAYVYVGDAQGNPYENNFGERQRAYTSYDKALKIRERMNTAGIFETLNNQGLVEVHLKICQLYFQRGKLGQALFHCEKGINIAEELHIKGRLDASTSRSLPTGYRTLGYALARSGRPDIALNRALKGQHLVESLANEKIYDNQLELDPTALQGVVADALVELRRYPEALELLKSVFDIHKAQTDKYTKNIKFRLDLFTDYRIIGDAYLAMGETKRARQYYQEGIAFIKKNAIASDNIRFRNLNAIIHVRLGRALMNLNQNADALKEFESVTPFFVEIAKKNPDDPYAQIHWSYTDMQRAVILARLNRSSEAIALAETANRLTETQYNAEIDSVEMKGISAGIYLMYGDVYSHMAKEGKTTDVKNRCENARLYYQKSLDFITWIQNQGFTTDQEYGSPEILVAKLNTCP